MLLRDLRLPNGTTMLYETGEIVTRPRLPTDLTWEELSGPGIYNPYANSKQPFVGCLTGGEIVADRLMRLLTEA